jgi:hypothetical protein
MIYKYECGHETEGKYKPSAYITKCPACYYKWKAGLSTEETREMRQAKLDRKSERRERWAASANKKAEAIMKSVPSYAHDNAFITQPGPEMDRARAKIHARYDRAFEMQAKAAEHLTHVGQVAVVKGDAEKRRQAVRDENDSLVKVGDKVYDWSFGSGVLMKINKKTYTIKFDNSGRAFPRDKSYLDMKRSGQNAS